MPWVIDPAHTRVNFIVKHMMIANVYGQFDKVTGTVEFDEQNPTQSLVDVQIDAASLFTREEKRNAHLKSPDFFEVEKYPYIYFKSKRALKVDDSHGKLVGDLTIKGITREVTLDVEYNGTAKTPWGTTNAGFTASAKINRKDWGLTWNVALETGGWLVGDDIRLNIEAEIVKQPEAVAEAVSAA
jgi:polyisoprenoid-binding protein YceI